MSRAFDPLRLDVAAFAATAGSLAGHSPLSEWSRLVESQAEGAPADQAVEWSAQGRIRPATVGEPKVWLDITASTRVWLPCQRCLAPMDLPLDLHTSLRFVAGEAKAEALDAESEFDVLALDRSLGLMTLLEDELLLQLPLVPRHEGCTLQRMPEPLTAPTAAPAPHPFAALKALRRG